MTYERPISWIKLGSCMICTSHAKNNYGYPRITRRGSHRTIARHILFNRYGKQPNNIVSRHTCDRRDCINPDHIIPGTSKENTTDRHFRRRDARGETHGRSKLTNSDVLEIKRLLNRNVTQSDIALRFGVVQQMISNIKLGLNWRVQ